MTMMPSHEEYTHDPFEVDGCGSVVDNLKEGRHSLGSGHLEGNPCLNVLSRAFVRAHIALPPRDLTTEYEGRPNDRLRVDVWVVPQRVTARSNQGQRSRIIRNRYLHKCIRITSNNRR